MVELDEPLRVLIGAEKLQEVAALVRPGAPL
jgi:hypothetical protein